MKFLISIFTKENIEDQTIKEFFKKEGFHESGDGDIYIYNNNITLDYTNKDVMTIQYDISKLEYHSIMNDFNRTLDFITKVNNEVLDVRTITVENIEDNIIEQSNDRKDCKKFCKKTIELDYNNSLSGESILNQFIIS